MVGGINPATKKYLVDRGISVEWIHNTLSVDRGVAQSGNVLVEPYIRDITKIKPNFSHFKQDPKAHLLNAILRKIENKDDFLNHLPWLKNEDYFGVPNIGAVFYQTKSSEDKLRPFRQDNIEPPPHLGVGITQIGLNQMRDIIQHFYTADLTGENTTLAKMILSSWLKLDERRTEWKPEWDDYQYGGRGNTRFINWPLDPPRIGEDV